MIIRVWLGAWTAALLVSMVLSHGAQAYGDRAVADRERGFLGPVRFEVGQSAADGDAAMIREGAALYAQRCADCHSADATGMSGPDLTGLWASGMSDARVFETIRYGRSGSIMPPSLAPDEQIQAIVAYLKSLGTRAVDDVTVGDAGRGREFFRSTCAECHQIDGQGGRLGPDLSRIADSRSRDELLGAIRYPDAAVTAGYRTVTLVTRDGQKIQGTLKGEDAFSVQIVDTRERLQGYLRADLREVIREDGSLMPEFGAEQLSDSGLDDLLRFLGTLRTTGGGQR